MKIPVPNLDDRTYDDIVRDAKSLIRQYLPEWTDFNPGDPGVTLVELFAWMAEMIIYRLNRVPEKNQLAFLSLIGIQRNPATPARALLTFSPTKDINSTYVPKDTQVDASQTTDKGDPIGFTTEKGINVSSVQLKKVITWSEDYDDNTDKATTPGQPPFDVFQGHTFMERALYLGDDRLFGIDSKGVTVELTFEIEQAKELRWELHWEYWDGAVWQALAAPSVEISDTTAKLSQSGRVSFKHLPASVSRSIHATPSNWIRARMAPPHHRELLPPSEELPTIRSVRGKVILDLTRARLRADAALRQIADAMAPIDLSKEFYLFGARPERLDSFYLSFDEAFSKPGAQIDIVVDLEPIQEVSDPDIRENLSKLVLRWEFFNGDGWELLGESRYQKPGEAGAKSPAAGKYFFNDGTFAFSQNGHITFDVPVNIKPRKLADQELHWIRARIVGGGYSSKDEPAKTYAPPFIHSLVLDNYRYYYEYPPGAPSEPTYCVAYRDFEFIDLTLDNQRGTGYKPYSGQEQSPALYLGFDKPFPAGKSFGLHFSVVEDVQASGERAGEQPSVIWQYWNGEEWAQFTEIHDRTESFTRREFLDFVAPSDHRRIENLLDLRQTITDLTQRRQHFQEAAKSPTTAQHLRALQQELHDIEAQLSRLNKLAESKNLFWFRALWQDGSFTQSPQLQLIRLNTTSAINLVTVNEERLGSSDGTPNQKFSLSQTPVFRDSEIWVAEPDIQPTVDTGPRVATASHDSTERAKAKRWRWNRVADFYASRPEDRHYTLDEDSGIVEFGDGQRGRIPPEGANNIIANYRWHAGKQGNLPADSIKVLIGELPEVDAVSNAEPSGGGSDSERTDDARYRGIRSLRHRYRAVTLTDYEALAREASSAIGATRALNYPDRPGEITVRIVPRPAVNSDGNLDLKKKLVPTQALLDTVRAYLDQRRLITTRIRVAQARYHVIIIELRVSLNPYPREALVLEEIKKKLFHYLHPTEGGPDNAGWPFGRLLHISEVFAAVEQIAGVDVVNDVLFKDARGRGIEAVDNALTLEPDELFFLKDVSIVVSHRFGK